MRPVSFRGCTMFTNSRRRSTPTRPRYLQPYTNTRVCNSSADGEAREEIESKVREAVEQSSRYLHTFDSMRKIDTRYDDALAFLIRYKQTVVADDLDPDEIAAVQRELADDAGLLKKVIDLMERQDHEIRMISVRLPPPIMTLLNAALRRLLI